MLRTLYKNALSLLLLTGSLAFRVDELGDNNHEDGWGFLAAWIPKTKENHRFAVEYLHIKSDSRYPI